MAAEVYSSDYPKLLHVDFDRSVYLLGVRCGASAAGSSDDAGSIGACSSSDAGCVVTGGDNGSEPTAGSITTWLTLG